MLRDGEETPAPDDSAQPRDVPTAPQPQAPAWPSPAPAARSPLGSADQGFGGYAGPYGGGYGGYAEPHGQGFGGYAWRSGPSPRDSYPQEEAYRFRPLGERERRRIEEQARYPDGSSYPYPSAGDRLQPQRQPGTGSPPTYGVDPMSRDPWMQDWRGQGWGTEGYGHTQPVPARPTLDRRQDRYGSPPRRDEWPPPEPGIFQEPSQWGAIPPDREPPSYRMYPSLDLHRDRRLTAR
jgi:hypothetical protein